MVFIIFGGWPNAGVDNLISIDVPTCKIFHFLKIRIAWGKNKINKASHNYTYLLQLICVLCHFNQMSASNEVDYGAESTQSSALQSAERTTEKLVIFCLIVSSVLSCYRLFSSLENSVYLRKINYERCFFVFFFSNL